MKGHCPVALAVCRGGLILASELHPDLFSWISGTPNRHLKITLEHHVIGEHGRQGDITTGNGGDGKDRKGD